MRRLKELRSGFCRCAAASALVGAAAADVVLKRGDATRRPLRPHCTPRRRTAHCARSGGAAQAVGAPGAAPADAGNGQLARASSSTAACGPRDAGTAGSYLIAAPSHALRACSAAAGSAAHVSVRSRARVGQRRRSACIGTTIQHRLTVDDTRHQNGVTNWVACLDK